MLTATQQHAVDEFAKSLSVLGDDALIDTYHQAWEDHTEASAEGSDNLSKAYAKVSIGTQKEPRIGMQKGPLCGVGTGLSR